ncbi:hypothetical protein ACVIM8_003508 [Bradyrhizobium sp. USDA 4529]
MASGFTEPSVATHSVASVSPRRIASTPSWIAVAPEAQAVDSEIGDPFGTEGLGEVERDGAEGEAPVKVRELPAATGRQVFDDSKVLGRNLARDFEPLRPLGLDRGDCQKQRAGKVALAADAGLLERFFGRDLRQTLRQAGRRERVDGDEIDGAGHRRLHTVEREACHGLDAGLTRGEALPIVGFAAAERRHDSHAGHDNDRSAEFIAWCCHGFPVGACAGLKVR